MMLQAAADIDVRLHILDPAADAPCARMAPYFTQGSFADHDTVLAFGKGKDVLTVEIEHVATEALEQLEAKGVKVYPQPRALRVIQDKGVQKQFYADHGIPTAPFTLVEGKAGITQFPVVQKMRTGGYDGKGVQILKSEADLEKAFDVPSVLEELVPFEKEISVIVARNPQGQIEAFPPVEMVFNPVANLVEFLFSPANISEEVAERARQIALKTAEALDIVGLLAIEMFLLADGTILVNEMAPRPHNSGHQTIEGNLTSQYQQHLRAILNLPLGATDAVMPSAMVNLLGAEGHTGSVRYVGLEEAMAMPGVYPHIYGKSTTKPFRKMGHVTVIHPHAEECQQLALKVKELIRVEAE
jgi:5-(carboxyamino)imidazole ribonucleotide synthase